MADEEGRSSGSRKTRRIVFLLCMLVFTAGASSGLPGSVQNPTTRSKWHPRRVPAGTEFVGDQVCAQCHKTKVASHGKSGMAMAMENIETSEVLTRHRAMTFRHGAYSYEIKRKDKESIYTVTDGRETISLPILYAVGHGKAGQTYVLQHEGRLYESLVSFFSEIGGLDFTLGAPRNIPASIKDALGRRLSDNEALNCIGCHSTGAVSGGRLQLDKLTPGIRCEACHGPGGQHAAAMKAGQPGSHLIFNPRRLSGDELAQDFCASCHRGSDEFSLLKSMEINNVRFQPYRIFHSKCYSDDRRISCTSCHDPHEPIREDAAYYDARCATCHVSAGKLAEMKDKPGAPEMTIGCRVGTKDCASCHMPKIGPPGAHFKFSDHYIRIVKPREAYPN